MSKKTEPAAPAYDETAFDAFLAALAEHGGIAKAATTASLTLDQVARRERNDKAFGERMKDARKVRRYLIADALLEEAIGVVMTDPINGQQRRIRNINVLQRLAVREDELDPEQKAGIAIQNNVGGSNDPKLVAEVKANSERLWALLKGDKELPEVIEGEVVELPAPDSVTTDEDLI